MKLTRQIKHIEVYVAQSITASDFVCGWMWKIKIQRISHEIWFVLLSQWWCSGNYGTAHSMIQVFCLGLFNRCVTQMKKKHTHTHPQYHIRIETMNEPKITQHSTQFFVCIFGQSNSKLKSTITGHLTWIFTPKPLNVNNKRFSFVYFIWFFPFCLCFSSLKYGAAFCLNSFCLNFISSAFFRVFNPPIKFDLFRSKQLIWKWIENNKNFTNTTPERDKIKSTSLTVATTELWSQVHNHRKKGKTSENE